MSDLYLVIDFEATCCDQNSIARHQMEIIEIGAVMAQGADGKVISEFQSFIRPVRHAKLTAFCTQLTSIKQSDVDSAPTFAAAFAAFKNWLYAYEGYTFGSWGDYDRKQLEQDCAFHREPYPIGASHVNLKMLFAQNQNLRKKPGLGDAMQLAKLKFAGTHHRGIDDARNIARLLPYCLGVEKLPSFKG